MKNNILILLIILLIKFNAFAQVPFNKIYENGIYTFTYNVFELTQGTYVTLGNTKLNNNSFRAIDINAFNEAGEHLWNKNYVDENYNIFIGAEGACKKTRGGYILAGSKNKFIDYDHGYHMVYLVKFNEAFDTLWTRSYFADSTFVTARNICNSPDGGFLIVGETKLNNDSLHLSNHNKGLALKVDSLGNYQWFKSFDTENEIDNFWKVCATHDGGYLIGGGTSRWQEYPVNDWACDWWLVKTDSLGNEQWSRQYGTLAYNDGRLTEILKSSDNSYYITGGLTYYRDEGNNNYNESTIIKLDADFNKVYTKHYNNRTYFSTYIMSAIEDQEGNIVFVEHFSDDSIGNISGLHKIRPNGEEIWSRKYATEPYDIYNSEYNLNSVKMASNGGFILAGWAYLSPLNPSQQIWLVKTDSLGCDGTGLFGECPDNSGIREPQSLIKELKVYPNPVADILTVEYIMFNGLRLNTMGIYDMNGHLLQTHPITKAMGVITIDVKGLPSGTYIIAFGTEGSASGTPFIVK